MMSIRSPAILFARFGNGENRILVLRFESFRKVKGDCVHEIVAFEDLLIYPRVS